MGHGQFLQVFENCPHPLSPFSAGLELSLSPCGRSGQARTLLIQPKLARVTLAHNLDPDICTRDKV